MCGFVLILFFPSPSLFCKHDNSKVFLVGIYHFNGAYKCFVNRHVQNNTFISSHAHALTNWESLHPKPLGGCRQRQRHSSSSLSLYPESYVLWFYSGAGHVSVNFIMINQSFLYFIKNFNCCFNCWKLLVSNWRKVCWGQHKGLFWFFFFSF